MHRQHLATPLPESSVPGLVPGDRWCVTRESTGLVAYVIARAEIKRRRDRTRQPEPVTDHEADRS